MLKADCDTEHISAERLKWRGLLTAKAYWICFSEMIGKVEFLYSNILNIDFDKKANYKKFWFISKNKEEPRLANRFEEEGSNLEQPLAIARDIKKLYERKK